MQVWADVYNSTGVKVAVIDQLVSAGATRRLDQAGTFDLQCALDEDVITHLVTGNEVALYVQEDRRTPVRCKLASAGVTCWTSCVTGRWDWDGRIQPRQWKVSLMICCR
jgi:hypothetical protein